MDFKSVHTRFRAYQLGSIGSSFSYWDESSNHFWLGEARLNADNAKSIIHELKQCSKSSIDALYISSWDNDHCMADELEVILKILKPLRILYPGYDPDPEKENQVVSKKLIDQYLGPPKPTKYRGTYGVGIMPSLGNILTLHTDKT